MSDLTTSCGVETTPTQSLNNDDRGFTLVEILLAITVMGVFMAAAAPGFYGLLKATALTDQRSVADGLAVKATEAIRSYPYYDVGYSTTGGTPSYCTGTQPVQLSYSTPMDTLASAATSTVAGTSYTVQSCVYWESASDGSSNAYKQLQVTVLWGSTKQYTFSETSGLYPGGEAAYISPGGQNFAPGSTTATTTAIPISAPRANSVTAISTSILQVDWSPVSYSPTPQYDIEYWAGDSSTPRPAQPSVVAVGYGTSDGAGGIVGQVSGLSAGASYDFDVIAFSGTQTSLASNVETGTTTSASAPSCTLSGINVSPNSPVVDKNGSPVGWTSLAITVNAANCTNLTVEYGLDNSGGTPQAPLTIVPLANSGSTWSGSATQSSWSAAAYGFVVYNNGAATTLQQNVTPCQEKGNSGHC
ncbi:MAG TPA: prepilin-type N-terminal cleavage/methylation domain-containing protein [Acidimicrobiales bacterium]|jgi:prepilin-type N-terminal cleavage/methylation domain-containing protein|nr:prepilin-type N-terminal cleavage/methylation domain-containing protein [Acidimicrobiales bacterium]